MSDSGSVNGDQNEEQDSLFSRSPSVAEESDEARWRASEPPEEIFGEGEWKYQIIGEEVDYEGNIKCVAIAFSRYRILIILARPIIDMR